MPAISVRRARAADRPVMERLWLMFRHDMSEFGGQLPNPDGTFRAERLAAAFEDRNWAGYVFTGPEDRPVGFAIIRSLDGPARVLNSFFVVRPMRRAGVGMQAASAIVAEHPGPWEVAFQDANAAAVRFWRRVATELAGDDWRENTGPSPASLICRPIHGSRSPPPSCPDAVHLAAPTPGSANAGTGADRPTELRRPAHSHRTPTAG